MNDTTRILILGASELQIPAIEKCRTLGYESVVVDRDSGAPGRMIATHFVPVSTTDLQGVVEVAKTYRPDGIITAATDMPMRALAKAIGELALPGPSYDAVMKATDKWLMSEAFRLSGVPAPVTVKVDCFAELRSFSKSYSYILKPADSSGSRGVILVDSSVSFKEAFHYAKSHSPSGVVLRQELITGSEVSVEGFCIGSEPEIVAVTDKLTSGAPHFVEVGHSVPSKLFGAELDAVEHIARAAVRSLDLENCAFHVELILTDDGPKVIEVGARLGGDFITSDLVPLATGVDMIAALLDVSTGRVPLLSPTITRASAIRFLFTSGDHSALSELCGIDGVYSVSLSESSDTGGVRNSTDRRGHVIAVADDAPTAVAATRDAVAILERMSEVRY